MEDKISFEELYEAQFTDRIVQIKMHLFYKICV